MKYLLGHDVMLGATRAHRMQSGEWCMWPRKSQMASVFVVFVGSVACSLHEVLALLRSYLDSPLQQVGS